jgi:hypothetical protein
MIIQKIILNHVEDVGKKEMRFIADWFGHMIEEHTQKSVKTSDSIFKEIERYNRSWYDLKRTPKIKIEESLLNTYAIMISIHSPYFVSSFYITLDMFGDCDYDAFMDEVNRFAAIDYKDYHDAL